MHKYNPFRPGNIVSPGMFSGRLEELDKLDQVLFQTKNGNPLHFIVQGERGIGKSSLLFYAQLTAPGEILVEEDAPPFKFLTVQIELEANDGYVEIIQKVGYEFRRVLASNQTLKSALKNVWDFVQKWEVMGVKYSAGKERDVPPHQMLDELIYTIHQALETLGSSIDASSTQHQNSRLSCSSSPLFIQYLPS